MNESKPPIRVIPLLPAIIDYVRAGNKFEFSLDPRPDGVDVYSGWQIIKKELPK